MHRRAALLFACLIVIACTVRPATAAEPRAVFFPETQQWLSDEFLQFWQATPRPLYILGYPISAPFVQESSTEPGIYYRVQYFERAVLEEHLSPDRQIFVQGRLLGNELIADRQTEPPFQPVKPPTKRTTAYDSITRHTIADTPAPFKRFYDSSGGLSIFGRPTSEQFQEQNRDTGALYWVQYFERQRLEWHPEARDPMFRVQLGRLGDEFRAAHPTAIDPRAFMPASPAVAPLKRLEYGVNATLYYTDQRRALGLASDAGFGWVRQQVHWKDHHSADGSFAWGELDTIVQTAAARNVKLLLSVTHGPDWATGIPRVTGLPDRSHLHDYATFIGAMAQRYRGRVQAYEVWNEINLIPENLTQPVPPPDYYIEMLVSAYDAINAADPQALVISSSLAPTEWRGDQRIAVSDLQYFRAMFADPRFWTHIDHVGVHVFGCANPPDTLWPDKPGSGQGWTDSREFYFRRIEDVRQLMIDSGHGNRQIWITEFGWATPNDTPGHEFGNQNTFDQQAQYLVQAIDMGRYEYTPWLGAMFVWNLNFAVAWQEAGDPQHQMAAYGILNGDWSLRPAYVAIQRSLH